MNERERRTQEVYDQIHANDRRIKKESEDRWHGSAKRSVSKTELGERARNMPGRGYGISNEGWWKPLGSYCYYNSKGEAEPSSGLMNSSGQWIGETEDSLRIKMERE